jgi:flavin reductase (DIM6/NTAB) family NADH-FMN oxidoreductase RutF
VREVEFSEATLRKYPEWIVLIVTVDADQSVNVMPAGWSMVTSHDPPLYAVSVAPSRYTHTLLRQTGEFTVAFPGPDLASAVRYCGTRSGCQVDKVRGTGLRVRGSQRVTPPLLEGAVANLECRVVAELETGDHTIFVGEVVAAHVQDDVPGRLLNFGPGLYALAQPVPGTEFRFQP